MEQASGEGQGLACPPVERMGGAGWGGGDLAASLALLAAPIAINLHRPPHLEAGGAGSVHATIGLVVHVVRIDDIVVW